MSPGFDNPSHHKVLLETGFFSLFLFLVNTLVAKVICKSPCAVVVNVSMSLEQSAEL